MLVICTEKYVEKSNLGIGGVGYEKMIVTSELVKNIASNKVIPVIRQRGCNVVLPTFLKSKVYIDLSNDELFESRLHDIIVVIHKLKKAEKPKLGKNPFSPESNKKLNHTRIKSNIFNGAKREMLNRLIDLRISLFDLYEEHLTDFSWCIHKFQLRHFF